jgi:phage terminase large subunit-like protein
MTAAADIMLAYCRGVIAGDVAAGRMVRLACERHLRDLDTGGARGLVFDAAEAQRWIDFFGLLPHVKGELAGQLIRLEPWQVFVIGSTFGWRRADGRRRYSTAYVEVPRKNAKTTIAAGVCLGGLLLDGEAGAEVYAAATKRDQAKICWGIARQMVRRQPLLRKRLKCWDGSSRIVHEDSASVFCPLGRDSDTLDGLNPSMVVIDELHAHKTAELWDVIATGEGARRQPLKFVITTAGLDGDTICKRVHDDCVSILDGQHADDSIFAYIATLDDPADWQTEHGARQANPNYGVSVKPDWLAGMVAKAIRMPSQQPSLKTKLFDLWVSSDTCWLPLETWDACNHGQLDFKALAGRRCWGGLDLASVRDIAAFVLVFEPIEDGRWPVVCRTWIPKETAVWRSHDERVPYLAWASDLSTGLKLTTGNRIDYATIKADILALGERFNIQDIGADRWNLEYLRQELGDAVEIVEFGQGFRDMSGPVKRLEGMVLGGELDHGGNPVLRWAIGNVTAETDSASNVKFSKKKSREKIDPAVALAMAIGRSMVGMHADDGESVYETRGLTILCADATQ